MEIRDVVVVSACRTALGRFLGGLSSVKPQELGAAVIREAVKRAGIKSEQVDECYMGNVVQAGLGQSPARQAAIIADLPPEVPSTTVNKVCGSGLKSIMLGAQAIMVGDAEIVVAGGMESMSYCPYFLHKGIRVGVKFGDQKLVDSLIHDGLWCAFEDVHMGKLAELVANEKGITREMQDEYALGSHKKAVAAIKSGKFKKEIVPVQIPQRKGEPITIDTDESPREDTTLEKLAKLRPAFQKDGTVTAGNAPGLNDGASAVVIMSDKKAKDLGIKPLARITAYTSTFVEPKWVFLAPVKAVGKIMDKLGVKIDHFDLIEANEAFAAQCLADGKELGWDFDRVNVNGGGIALGHPIGASGARVVTTLLYAMKDRGKKTGLATLCLGGGGAVAMSFEAM
ncbi:acetyl-CoA C-acetyltransferase [candidate division TA06 bacterium]|uniref:Acetyl-CoA C-acetyltransferase n=1 Tax=candidate division TA06 bacterium TaxID=2250710 RepID=A0A523UWD1_UNCT6|nr:MAG: acetyl-CoA C-acetyltransferase [candidate division TA06 bacterium]